MGEKIGPIIAAMCGIKDTKTILEISKYITDETYKSIEHIKHIMNDFLSETTPDGEDVDRIDD